MRIISILQINFTGNFTLTSTSATAWAFLEPPIGIVVACLTTFRPVLERCYPERLSRLLKSSSWNSKRSAKRYGTLEEDRYELKSNTAQTTASSLETPGQRTWASLRSGPRPERATGTAETVDHADLPSTLEHELQSNGIAIRHDITVSREQG